MQRNLHAVHTQTEGLDRGLQTRRSLRGCPPLYLTDPKNKGHEILEKYFMKLAV